MGKYLIANIRLLISGNYDWLVSKFVENFLSLSLCPFKRRQIVLRKEETVDVR